MRATSISGISLGKNKLPKQSKVLDCIPKNSPLVVNSKGDVVITSNESNNNDRARKENLYQSTVSRLSRKRRLRNNNNFKNTFKGQAKQSLSLMTWDDKCFPNDDFSMASRIGERYIGVLSGPEHVGRFG